MNILIIEDCSIQRRALKSFIEKEYLDIRVYETATYIDSKKIYVEKNIDLFFIDINLGKDSGIEIASEIRKLTKYKMTGIIFVTTEMARIIDAFKNIHCYDFLIKPYNKDDIKKIIDTFMFEYEERTLNASTMFNIGNNLSVKIKHDDIVFIEYKSRKCFIYTFDDIIEVSGESLKSILKKLNSKNIIQAHKSFIINLKYIYKIEKIYNKLWEISFDRIEHKSQMSYKYRENILEKI